MQVWTNRVRSAAVTVLLSLPVGCGSQTQDHSSPGAGEHIRSTEQNLIYCDGRDAQGFQEHYLLAAINRKLGYYPELAAEVGRSSVATCEEARAFRDTYLAYSELHAGFDNDQPLPPMPELPAEGPSGPSPTFEGPKLLGGKLPQWAYPNSPVVKLVRHPVDLPSEVPAECTGTFIGPSFVLTAAHCLMATGVLSSEDPRDLTGYPLHWQWEVKWADINGNLVGGNAIVRSRGLDVLQYANPAYMGTGMPAHDLALLYLFPQRYQSILPPVHGGGAMRLSMSPPGVAPHAADPTYFAGFSSPFDAPNATLQFLRWGQALLALPNQTPFILRAPILFPPGPARQPGTQFPAGTQTPLCRGDSGGPAYRLSDALVRTTPQDPGTQAQVPVMVGVSAFVAEGNPRTPGPLDDCSGIGDTDVWTRIDAEDDGQSQKLAWIQSVLELWGQSCKTKSLAGQTADDFVQCWGDPCDDESDCAADEFCDEPGTENSQCLAMIVDEHDDLPMPPAP